MNARKVTRQQVEKRAQTARLELRTAYGQDRRDAEGYPCRWVLVYRQAGGLVQHHGSFGTLADVDMYLEMRDS